MAASRMKSLNIASLAALCMLLALAGCSALPSLDNRTRSTALDEASANATTLGRANLPRTAAHPDKSGIHVLQDAHDAFAARMLLAHAAEKTLDVQYYIWRNDLTGTMLFEALRKAADRGVRVRLLLDDNNTAGLETALSALDAHPNIEVRLFNPFVPRQLRIIGYLTDFSRANRRMHNKSFTADNQATIIGGRNIGDEYFGATSGVLFADLDVLAVGPVVKDVSRDFDRYWDSASSYPVGLVLPPVDPEELQQLAANAASAERKSEAAAYMRALRHSTILGKLAAGDLPLEWATTHMLSDHPDKGLGRAADHELITHDLLRIIGNASADVELISPYFVPTQAGVDALVAMKNKGVRIRILTNSLDATDVAAVHAGYAKRRAPLLKAGIELFELRRLSPTASKPENKGKIGSSGSSLHAKTFAIDRERVFVGSFNFDPRSARLNTELGFIIESPALAARIDDAFENDILHNAYTVHLDEHGKLYWNELVDGKSVRHDIEPGTSAFQRSAVRFLSILPIEWLL
ncbi:MAG: phospholipase D family protein [Oxalicibacterium faecigallinarum]|uniref:phospholipase D family protein n=1 Tax=Oxalicibacterium faecigallinarum TaxID=573741 RepID=UPI002808A29E|nr:phospholipase D family protein [Oxalicibacterium faecigallinarum]MDQ7970406.1 phospholipase D family protein [Oxalicibacterium faecigallinarum]